MNLRKGMTATLTSTSLPLPTTTTNCADNTLKKATKRVSFNRMT